MNRQLIRQKRRQVLKIDFPRDGFTKEAAHYFERWWKIKQWAEKRWSLKSFEFAERHPMQQYITRKLEQLIDRMKKSA